MCVWLDRFFWSYCLRSLTCSTFKHIQMWSISSTRTNTHTCHLPSFVLFLRFSLLFSLDFHLHFSFHSSFLHLPPFTLTLKPPFFQVLLNAAPFQVSRQAAENFTDASLIVSPLTSNRQEDHQVSVCLCNSVHMLKRLALISVRPAANFIFCVPYSATKSCLVSPSVVRSENWFIIQIPCSLSKPFSHSDISVKRGIEKQICQ